ncbi:ClpX C4-type zinc finger protein [Salmonella enterica]|uniref:ClpX C4-type zinc finger protein n=1 Tax=Salmonella enterica TaxID=28901 RepID=UPI0009AF7508|nr:ClpX C4-type zinc finger protein [Salmonella enterica]EBF9470374.1 hypothetical protein [Salmonella enterica subsp. enterica serovar Corvallis]MBJ5313278.1 hypothetical protein [Salmonella enterica subsp. enterica serovar Dabou]HBN1189524.1 hypothetical protein [Salmonella enterica subsp. enterica serovar Schwarzengrund]EBS2088725.1 hypothetical protein [Salmonella enterica subsp. enterica serovar Corvallis]ECJ5626120.1 hypothetical protein [Salmonella enterica]
MNNYYTCSFCGVSELDAKKLIAKGSKDEPAICSECVVSCVNILINYAAVIKPVKLSVTKGGGNDAG